MRAQANSAVPASQPPAATAAARGRRAAASPTAASRAAVTAVCCGRRPSAASARVAPARPVQPAHEDVVGVAGLHADADPPVGRPHRMGDPPLPADQPGAGVHDPQGQVGVLAEGAGEALVEAADGRQRRAPVGEVGGDPAAGGQPGGAALPVGGPAVLRQRHPHPALAAGDVGRQVGEVPVEPLVPVGVGDDVVVEEGDPLGARRCASRGCARGPGRRRRCGRRGRAAGRGVRAAAARRWAGRRPGSARPGGGPGPRRGRRAGRRGMAGRWSARRRCSGGAAHPWVGLCPDAVPQETLRA